MFLSAAQARALLVPIRPSDVYRSLVTAHRYVRMFGYRRRYEQRYRHLASS
jgi:hypothetical protein